MRAQLTPGHKSQSRLHTPFGNPKLLADGDTITPYLFVDVRKRNCHDYQLEFNLLFYVHGTPSVQGIAVDGAGFEEVGDMTGSSFPCHFDHISRD